MIHVDEHGIRGHAERLVAGPVGIDDLALGFQESRADTTELLVTGSAFYPRMLADIEAAESSIHINQFGFKPGVVGDQFAELLAARPPRGSTCESSSIARAAAPTTVPATCTSG